MKTKLKLFRASNGFGLQLFTNGYREILTRFDVVLAPGEFALSAGYNFMVDRIKEEQAIKRFEWRGKILFCQLSDTALDAGSFEKELDFPIIHRSRSTGWLISSGQA